MKKVLFSLALLVSVAQLFGQNNLPTYGYNYQTVVRHDNGAPVLNTPLQLRFRILDAADQVLYEETHDASTNQFGHVSRVVGSGTATNGLLFDTLNWAAQKHFLGVAVKIGGVMDWEDLGKGEIVHQPLAKGSSDWINLGDTMLYTLFDTTSPSNLLVVEGGNLLLNNAGAGNIMRPDNLGVAFQVNNQINRSYGGLEIRNGIGDLIHMVVENGGNVGIGTTNPIHRLVVEGGNLLLNNAGVGNIR